MQEKRINNNYAPLADRMRPETLNDYVGQKHLLIKGSLLYEMITNDNLTSMIFFGPPGVGKTTLAHIIAKTTNSHFISFSAVTSGMKEIKEVLKEAREKTLFDEKTILFIDEIHRFNKAQQDAFLPYVENGSIILIGATTENPSFEINNALLSRCRTFLLEPLSKDDINELIRRAISKFYSDKNVIMDDETINIISSYANGDARFALNTLEMLLNNSPCINDEIKVSRSILKQCLNRKAMLYDKNGEEHYNLISALHKSMRNSDIDASIYYLARMLEGGEDPLYVARRIVRFASEDIGMADSRALEIAVAAYDAAHYLGMPECSVHLTHAVTYCALAPKSNALYVAYEKAKEDAIQTSDIGVPLHLRNAPTRLMKELDYSKGYEYSQDYKHHMTDMVCMPKELCDKVYYVPQGEGTETKVALRMEQIKEIKKNYRKQKGKL